MQKRKLGKSNFDVSALGLGCMGMSIAYGPPADKQEMIGLMAELGIGLVPFSPLGKSFLTGKIDENTTFDSSDFRNIVPRFTPEARKANQDLVDLLAEICRQRRAQFMLLA